MNFGDFLSSISLKPERTEIISKVKYQDIVLNCIQKRDSAENLKDILKTIEKIYDNKIRLMNTSKLRIIM